MPLAKIKASVAGSKQYIVEHNPYAPTQGALNSTVPVEQPTETLELAKRWRRCLNYLIDFAASVAVSGIVVFIALLVSPAMRAALEQGDRQATIQLLALIGTFIYYTGLEVLFGWTVGKLLTGTRVVSEDGTPGLVNRWTDRGPPRILRDAPIEGKPHGVLPPLRLPEHR